MPKRIALFVLGLVLAVVAFLVYQNITGSTMQQNKVKRVSERNPADTLPATWEQRDLKGRLQLYVTAAKSPEQVKDDAGNPLPGHFQMDKPHAFFYQGGRVIEIVADRCELVVDQAPQVAGSVGSGKKLSELVSPRLGRLTGNVRMRVSGIIAETRPGELKPEVKDIIPGGLTVHFDGPLEYDGARQIISTADDFHVRSALIETDLRGIQLSLNQKEERIEFLSVQANPRRNQMILREIASRVSVLMDKQSVTTKPAVAATQGATAVLPATQPATTQVAKAGKPATTYELHFGEDFRGTIYGEKENGEKENTELVSHLLAIIFRGSSELMEESVQPGAKARAPAPTTNGAPLAAGPPATAAATPAVAQGSIPGPLVPPTLLPIPEKPAPLGEPRKNDMLVSWAGELLLKPAADPTIKFEGEDDIRVVATGTATRRVSVKDPRFEMESDRLSYQTGQPIEFVPEGNRQTVLRDLTPRQNKDGTQKGIALELTGGKLVYDEVKNLVTIAGPATATSINTSFEKTVVSWNQLGIFTMARLEKPSRDGRRGAPSLALSHATLPFARLQAPTMEFAADLLDVAILNLIQKDRNGQDKFVAVPEAVSATGRVRTDTWYKEDRMPQTHLEADQLLLKSTRNTQGVPEWSEMLADGQVVAWRLVEPGKGVGAMGLSGTTQPGTPTTNVAANADTQPRKEPRKLADMRREEIQTSQLVASLRLKEKKPTDKQTPATVPAAAAEAGEFDNMTQDVEVTKLVAANGVRITMTPPTSAAEAQMIVATAQLMEALPLANTATLSAAEGNPTDVHIQLGGNLIEARKILLDGSRNAEMFDVPGPGRAVLVMQPDGTGKRQPPMDLSWRSRMHYDHAKMLAEFYGNVDVQSRGNTTPAQGAPGAEFGQFKAMELLVQLKVETPVPAGSGTAPEGRGGATAVAAASRGRGTGAVLPATGPASQPRRGSLGPAMVLDWIHAKGAVDAGGSQTDANNGIITGMNIKAGELRYSDTTKKITIPGAGRIAIIDNRPEETASTSTTRPVAASSRGISVFEWKESLGFDGQEGQFTLKGDVKFWFTPNKPLAISSGLANLPKPRGTTTAPAAPRPQQVIHLQTSELVARLARDKNASANRNSGPIDMDGMVVTQVEAKGAQLSLDDYFLEGNSLVFDVVNGRATISGQGENTASVRRTGQARVEADRFILHLDRNKGFLEATRPRGDIIPFGG